LRICCAFRGYPCPCPECADGTRQAGTHRPRQEREIDMQNITITIGRGVPEKLRSNADTAGILDTDGQNLSDEAWGQFTDEVLDELTFLAVDLGATEYWHEEHTGLGDWDGQVEESAKLTLLFEAPALAVLPHHRQVLAQRLADLRSRYRQDAVAVSWGDSDLV
jgi:hypothetical protein